MKRTRKSIDILYQWGRSINNQNRFDIMRSSGAIRSLLGRLYRAKGINEDDAKDRSDSMAYRLDMDRIGGVVDGLPRDIKAVLWIRFIRSKDFTDGVNLYREHKGEHISRKKYKDDVDVSIKLFEVAYG